jgi:hypothetical protein
LLPAILDRAFKGELWTSEPAQKIRRADNRNVLELAQRQ